MEGEIRLNRIRSVLETFEYPVQKDEAVTAAADVTVEYADGTEELDAIIERTNEDEFESVEDLEAAVFGNVSIGAVGEPGQSEGDA